jgi:hypothetical protein
MNLGMLDHVMVELRRPRDHPLWTLSSLLNGKPICLFSEEVLGQKVEPNA